MAQPLETTETTAPADETTPPAESANFFTSPLFLLAVLLWVMVLWSLRKQKKKEKDRKSEIESLKKGDRVVTIGRMHATVVSTGTDTVTLKPDPKANLTMEFDRIAIHRVIPRDEKKGGEEKESA